MLGIKSIIKVGVIAAVGVCAVMGTSRALSYLKTSRSLLQQTIDDSTPMEFHLERLKTMMAELDPELTKNRQMLAGAEVDAKELQEEIARVEPTIRQAKERIVRRRQMLASDDDAFYIGGQRYTRDAVTAELETQVDAFTSHESQLKAKHQLLEARQKVVQAARQKVGQFEARRRSLEVQAAQLTSQLRLVEARQTANQHLTLDGAKLSEAEELAKALRRKLDVAEKMTVPALPPAGASESDEPRNVLKEIDEKFDLPGKAVADGDDEGDRPLPPSARRR